MTIDNVYGHERAKKVLKSVINRSRERYYRKIVQCQDTYPDRLNCLLVGQSGTGKTHLVRQLADQYNINLVTIDATQLAPTSAASGKTSDDLRKAINQAVESRLKEPGNFSRDGVKAQTVVFVDEFDKLGNCFDSSGNWNTHVQSNFLTLVDDKGEFADVTWIFAGAFTKLYVPKSRSIGFFAENVTNESELCDADIVRAGIIPEMVGRISLIVQLDTFTLRDYERITEQLLYDKYVTLKSVDVARIAQQAMSSGQGVRSVMRQLEMALIDQESDMPWLNSFI